MFFKRVTNYKNLHSDTADLVIDLVKEVDPYWVVDLSGFQCVFQDPDFWWLEIYNNIEERKLIGFVAFTIARDVFQVYKRASLFHMYLKPEHRKFKGGRVIRAVEKICRDQGAINIMWSAHHGSAMEKCFRAKHGYTELERTYIKKLTII